MEKVSLRYKLEYAALRSVFWIFERLGQKRASAFGGWLARKIGTRLSVNRLASKNLKQAMPYLSDSQVQDVLVKMWDNLGRNIAEIPYLQSLLEAPDAVELVGSEYMDAQIDSGKSAFFVTAHFGPWELVQVVGKYIKNQSVVLYRAANNPLVEAYFQSMRLDLDNQFFSKGREGAKAMLKAVRDGRAIGLLNDQKLNGGVAVPFFGRDAMTAPAVAEIARKMDVPIYPMKVERLEGGKFRATVYPALNLKKTDDRDADVYETLKSINEVYEEWITERPDHWFWVHNRWP
jgi:Kdo2-lipid IVA lauroyltransferase/acyltransferase